MGERRDGTEYSGRREGRAWRGGEGIQQAWAGGRTDEGRGGEGSQRGVVSQPAQGRQAGRKAGRGKGEGGHVRGPRRGTLGCGLG